MIVNCGRRALLVFGWPTPTQLCSNGSNRLSGEVPDRLCHSLSVDLSNTAWAQRNTFGAVTWIRPIIIITFGSANLALVLVLGIGDHDRQRYYAKILIHLVPYPNDSVTNGNRAQNHRVTFDAGPNDSITFGA